MVYNIKLLYIAVAQIFFLWEEFQSLDVGKLNKFYSYQYSDEFLSIDQINFFFWSEKQH